MRKLLFILVMVLLFMYWLGAAALIEHMRKTLQHHNEELREVSLYEEAK